VLCVTVLVLRRRKLRLASEEDARTDKRSAEADHERHTPKVAGGL
jgi:hypothetical protein